MCYRGVTAVLQGSCMDLIGLFLGCYRAVTEVIIRGGGLGGGEGGGWQGVLPSKLNCVSKLGQQISLKMALF